MENRIKKYVEEEPAYSGLLPPNFLPVGGWLWQLLCFSSWKRLWGQRRLRLFLLELLWLMQPVLVRLPWRSPWQQWSVGRTNACTSRPGLSSVGLQGVLGT